MANSYRIAHEFSIEAAAMAKSRSKSIGEIVTRALIEGVWMPGDRINDQELSERLNVSRISVREALSSLVERRIVEKVHWKGYFVRKLTLEEIESIIEVRMVLEELAVKKLISSKAQDIYGEMQKAIDNSEQVLASSSYSEYMETDFRFHELMYEGSGNLWIKNIISDLRLHINILRNLSMKTDYRKAAALSIHDHRDILEKLAVGDEAGAVELLRAHFSTHLRNIRAAYAQ